MLFEEFNGNIAINSVLLVIESESESVSFSLSTGDAGISVTDIASEGGGGGVRSASVGGVMHYITKVTLLIIWVNMKKVLRPLIKFWRQAPMTLVP